MITLHTDAATQPKNGKTGVGIVYRYDHQHVTHHIPLLNHYNNHEGEFIALIIALDILISENLNNEHSLLVIYSDSQTLIEAITENRIHHPSLKELLNIIKYRLKNFSNVELQWISEKENKEADKLACQALQLVETSSLPHLLNPYKF